MSDDVVPSGCASVFSFMLRLAFLMFIAVGGFVGTLMAGFAGDSPTRFAWGTILIGANTLVFVLSGVGLAFTPSKDLLAQTSSTKALWWAFGASMFLPFFVAGVAKMVFDFSGGT